MRRFVFPGILVLAACGEAGEGASVGMATAETATESAGTETTGAGTSSAGTTGAGTVSEGQTGSSTTTGGEPTTGSMTTGMMSEGTTTAGTTTTGMMSEGTTSEGTTSEGTTTAGMTTEGDTMVGESTTTGGSMGGESPLIIAVVDAYLWANCSMGGGDPVQGSWYVEFDNTDNPNETAAVLTSASLSLSVDRPLDEPIDAEPKQSPPIAAGDYVSQKQTKLKGEAHSACDHCDEFYTLVLEYDEGGVPHHVEEDVTISCMF